jgi:hypothetical protein
MIGNPFQIATDRRIGQSRIIDRASFSGEPMAELARVCRSGRGGAQRKNVLPISLILRRFPVWNPGQMSTKTK